MKRAIPPGVDVWIVHLQDTDMVQDDLLVRDEDRARYNRIVPLQRRRQFIFRRHVRDYVLRQYASHHKVRIDGMSGKPYVLSRRGRQPMYFSTSASRDVCAVGVSRNPLGLDIEASDRPIDMVDICERFLPQFKRWSSFRHHKDWLRQAALGAWCRTEAYGKRVFAGRVREIAPLGKRVQNVTYFEVKIEVTDPAAALLKPRMSGDGEIVTEVVEDAVVVPETALRYDGDRVLLDVLNGDAMPTAREVEVGIVDGARVQIVKGLEPGEHVQVH